MQSRLSILLRSLRVGVRLSLGLVLLVGLGVMVAGVSQHAHAAPAATLTVTDCSGETGPGRIGTVIGSASAGDRITFSCSGTIPISSTLTISTNNLTLDGSGQTVTLDGGNSTQVLFVNSGVSFTLKALTVAHGLATSPILGEPGFGGGIANSGTLSISNSTFSDNSAGIGGGIANGGTLSISNSTLSANSAPNGNGGGIFNNSGTVSIGGSIVATNAGGDCAGSGTLTDQGYNLESGTDCGFTGTGSKQNTDPKLGPLASKGGPTQTMALLKGSPAIDYIPLTSGVCPATDQRGHKRPDNPHETACDIGAYES